jgi:hypothetical protein
MSDILDEAKMSAKSIRENMPEANIALITDEEIETDLFDIVKIVDDPSRGFEDKLKYIEPIFDKTLYIDTDTYFTDDVSEIFEILDNYDVAAAHAAKRDPPQADVPDAYPPFNAGVIAMRKNDNLRQFLQEWKSNTNEMKETREGMTDQEGLHRTLYESEIKTAVLPSEYNVRIPFQGYLISKAKILHGRFMDIETDGIEKGPLELEEVVEKINGKTGSRVFYTYKGELKVKKNKRKAIVRVKDSIRRRGVKDTIKEVFRRIF